MVSFNKDTLDWQSPDSAIERWADVVWRVVYARLQKRQDAEDAFQDTFLALCRANPTFESLEHQKAWLLRCACNCCNQIARRRASHPEHSLNGFEENIAFNVLHDHESYFLYEELYQALELLSPAQRTSVHLYYYEGFSTDEIAFITNEKPSTVRSHLHRARQTLRIEFEKNKEDHHA